MESVRWPPAIPAGNHLYDGCLHLNDIGCGYSSFLVVTGPHRGTVWVDYSAGDGDITPVGPFIDWYEEWLDRCATSLLGEAVRTALAERSVSPQDAFIRRWAVCFERVASLGGPMDRADLVALRLYQGRRAEAGDILGSLEQLSLSDLDEPLAVLSQWYDPHGAQAATAKAPGGSAAGSPLWRIRRMVAENPQAPADVLAALVHDERAEVRRAAAAHPGCPPDALSALAASAERRWTPQSRLECLYELDLVARHLATAPDTVESLARLPDRIGDVLASTVARAAAGHPTIAVDSLHRLATSPWPWVRAAVAAHPAATPPVFPAFSEDEHPAVRAAVAARPDAGDLLWRLAHDPVTSVRGAVAGNATASADVLRLLGTDLDGGVVFHLARNPVLAPEVVEVLRDHADDPLPSSLDDGSAAVPESVASVAPVVSVAPVASVAAVVSVAPAVSVAAVVAGGQVADADYPYGLLAAAVAHPDPMVGYAAGRSPWLDGELLQALSRHPYPYARVRVADHHAPPVDALIRLVHDEQPMVARFAAARSPVGEVVALATDQHDERRWGAADNPHLPGELLRQLAEDPSNYVRRAVLGNPATPADVVDRLVRDSDPLVRVAGGRRSDLSAESLDALLHDDDESVARAARWARGRRRLLELSDSVQPLSNPHP